MFSSLRRPQRRQCLCWLCCRCPSLAEGLLQHSKPPSTAPALAARLQRADAEAAAGLAGAGASDSEAEAGLLGPLPEDHIEIEKSNVLILVGACPPFLVSISQLKGRARWT